MPLRFQDLLIASLTNSDLVTSTNITVTKSSEGIIRTGDTDSTYWQIMANGAIGYFQIYNFVTSKDTFTFTSTASLHKITAHARLEPSTDDSLDFGKSTKRWRDIYVRDAVVDAGIKLTKYGNYYKEDTVVTPSPQNWLTPLGYTWTVQSTPAGNNSWHSVAWSPTLSLFVAVGQLSVGNIMKSSDGIVWSLVNSGIDEGWVDVVWADDLGFFVAVANTNGGKVMTSNDGDTWTIRTTPGSFNWYSIAWAKEIGTLCAVARGGVGGRVMTSTNATTWTERTASNSALSLNHVVWASKLNLFVLVANGGPVADQIQTSADGITWNSVEPPVDTDWFAIGYSPELDRLVTWSSSSSTSAAMTSDDAVTWTSRTTPNIGGIEKISWSPELGLFIGLSQTSGLGVNRLVTSPDGITWTLRAVSHDAAYIGHIWSSEMSMFVAVSQDANQKAVITSKQCFHTVGTQKIVANVDLDSKKVTNVTSLSSDLITLADGSVTAPSLTFTSDTNTGIYRIGADALGFTTGGTKAAELNSGQNLVLNKTNSTSITNTDSMIQVLGNISLLVDGSIIANAYWDPNEGAWKAVDVGASMKLSMLSGVFSVSKQVAATSQNEIIDITPNNFSITSTGLVGVGDNTAETTFHVYENTSSTDQTTGFTIENAGAGDATLQFLLNGGQRYMFGIDNSDSDKLKLSRGTDLGTNVVFEVDTSGNATSANLTVTGTTTLSSGSPSSGKLLTSDGSGNTSWTFIDHSTSNISNFSTYLRPIGQVGRILTTTASNETFGLNLNTGYISPCVGFNGKIYILPDSDSTNILIIDPFNNTAVLDNLGANLSDTGGSRWNTAILAGNGKIYCIPGSATDILIIDTINETATRSALGADLTGNLKWDGGVMARDGRIFGIPNSATDILIIDTNNDTATRSNLGGPAFASTANKWAYGCLGLDGKIYCAPAVETEFLIIDPINNSYTKSALGVSITSSDSFIGFTMAPDGRLFSIPAYADFILIINTATQTATKSNLGAAIDKDGSSHSWSGAVLMSDGKIYGVPSGSPDFIIVDPLNNTASLSNLGATIGGVGINWAGGVVAPNGKAYMAPGTTPDNVLVLTTTAPPFPQFVVTSPYINKY